jgi:outer membrane protein assembly factor BamB/tRNA A-37 threonylcarbamoyl transferase component Bud32
MGNLTTRPLTSRRDRQPKLGQKGQLQPGDMLQGRYRVVGILGIGGFSSVYQARDMRFSTVTRLCAIKEMVNTAADPQMRELTTKSFEREASILATLDHPAVPDVYDYFTEADRSYLVLEFIRGKDLDAMLAEQQGFFEQERVLDWALQLCDVLSYLHNHRPQPVVFRDLKPSNIMLDPYGRIRLIDFGIAKLFQSGEKGTMIGTEGYSPPEQYRGESGPAADVYALGATLHHVLTRQDPRLEPPFSFGERPITGLHPAVSKGLEGVVMRCLAYNVKDRYPDAVALKEALLKVSQVRPSFPGLPGAESLLSEESLVTADSRPVAPIGIKPVWAFKCEDEVRSTAAVAEGVVFVGAYDNNLYALTADSGRFLWKFPATDGIGSSPSVYGDSVFIGSVDRHLYSLRRVTGRLNWRFATGGAVYSSPRASFDHVFFGSDDGHLYAVNVANGRQAWKVPAHTPVRSSPRIGDNCVYFGCEGGYVFCIELTGKVRWQFQAKRGVTSTPALAEDMVFVGSLDGSLYALDANSGWAIWSYRTRRPILSSPVVHQGMVYIGSSDGSLYALEVASGRKAWVYETRGQINSTPAVHGNAIYFGCTDGAVYSLDTRKGELRWRFETGGLVVASPTIANGVMFIGSADRNLYALSL